MPAGLKRYHTFGHDHFITFTCYHRLPYLNDDHSRTIFEQTLEQTRQRHHFDIYGYVLMPEHVHLLLSEPPETKLEDIFRILKTQTSKQLKGDREHFWQRRYYDLNVFTRPKFIEKLRYIHRNPVKRGLVENPEDWPWSSYHHWQTGEQGHVTLESDWTWNARVDPTEPLIDQPWQTPATKRKPK